MINRNIIIFGAKILQSFWISQFHQILRIQKIKFAFLRVFFANSVKYVSNNFESVTIFSLLMITKALIMEFKKEFNLFTQYSIEMVNTLFDTDF